MAEMKNEQAEVQRSASDNSAILRDHLATDRTIQANERTLLAYVRTALTMFVAGVTFIRFFNRDIYTVIGTAFIPLSIVIMLIGVWRYRHMKTVLRAVARENGFLPHRPIPKD